MDLESKRVWELFTFLWRVNMAGAAARALFMGRVQTGGRRLAE